MVFYSFFGLETSFLAYICIFGQIRKKCKKKNFLAKTGGHFGKFQWKPRARADGSITRSILLWFLRFLEWCFMTVLSQMYFFIFLINWKLTISGYILKWRDYFSLFWTFFDFQRHLKSPIYFFLQKIKKYIWDNIVIKHHSKNLRNPSKIERVMDLSARARVVSFGKMTINVRIYLDLWRNAYTENRVTR